MEEEETSDNNENKSVISAITDLSELDELPYVETEDIDFDKPMFAELFRNKKIVICLFGVILVLLIGAGISAYLSFVYPEMVYEKHKLCRKKVSTLKTATPRIAPGNTTQTNATRPNSSSEKKYESSHLQSLILTEKFL